MLTLQIAAGIILAYVVIVNQRRLIAAGGWLLRLALICGVIAALVWVVGQAVQLGGAAIPHKLWSKLLIMIGCIPLFALAASGTVGMMMLIGLVGGRRPEQVLSAIKKVASPEGDERSGCLFGIGMVILTFLINVGLSFPAWAYTPLGGWYAAVDTFSRANGWQDGLSAFFGMVLWQWVWIPVGFYFLVRKFRTATMQEEQV